MDHNELFRLAFAAIPVDETDDGSERQINAQTAFFAAVEPLIPPAKLSEFQLFRGTTGENIAEALKIAGLLGRIEFAERSRINGEGDMVDAYVIPVNEMNIYDAYTSDCGRFDCSPAEYGITKAEADALLLLNFGHTQEEALTKELNEWYAAPAQSNIPEKERGCALELLMVADALKLTTEQRRYLQSFNARWDIAARAQ